MVEPSFRRWSLALGPFAVLMLLLWTKLICFDLRVNLGRQWLNNADERALASASLAILLLLFAPLLILRCIPRLVVALIFGTMLTTLLLADLMYFRFFDDVPSVSDLPKIAALPYILPSIRNLFQATDVFYYLDILAAATVLPLCARASRSSEDLSKRARVLLCASVCISGMIAAAPSLQLIWARRHDVSDYTTVRRDIGTEIGILPYHFYEAVASIVSPLPGSSGIGERARRHLTERFDLLRQRLDMNSPLFGVARGRNVILISAESLQAFPKDLVIAGQEVMPNLAAFARESLDFVRFYDQTYFGTTVDAEFMALQSLYPLPSGCIYYRYSNNRYRALPTILSEHGYVSVSACGVDAEFMQMAHMHERYGVQLSYFAESLKGEQFGGWLSDVAFFRQLPPLLKSETQRFMAFLVSCSGHDPFVIPDAHKVLKLGPLEGTRLGDYLHAVHFFDQAFGEFIRSLRETGLLDESVIVLYGDHQGFLRNPPELATLMGFDAKSRFDFWLMTKRLPFLIRLPKGAAAGKRDAIGGHLDIAPTILSLLGIPARGEVMLGKDLTTDTPPLVVFRDGSFVDETHVFMNRRGALPRACFETSTRQPVDCASLESKREAALDRLRTSDNVIEGDLIPMLAPPNRVRWVRLEELPAPEPFSMEFGTGRIVLSEAGLDAHPPSGATFSVPTGGHRAHLTFTPSFHNHVPRDKTDGVTFEIWHGPTRLYHRHVLATEPEHPARLNVPSGNPSPLKISLVTRPGPSRNTDYDWALWRRVRFIVEPE